MQLFICPPFGNYIDLPFATSIKGSYTLHERNGLLYQILKTLRYSFVYNGWINKIGLRNKGIDHILTNYNDKSIYSLAILDPSDISKMVEKIPPSVNIEINISCPNAEKSMVYQGLKPFQNSQRKWCIIKLSPLVSMDTINNLYQQGFRQFHISNTLPTSRGGLSGPSLKEYNLKTIKSVREKYPDVEIIGGGGVQSIYDANLYKTAGANHVGISTLLFHPLKTISFYNDWKKYSKYI
tara:strand:+ start:324 stop:1037 length:714 start_codon:yes stop_codon:yes gene_type:complete